MRFKLMVGKETPVIGHSSIKSVFLRPPHDIVYTVYKYIFRNVLCA